MSNNAHSPRALRLILAVLGFLAIGLVAPAIANAGPKGGDDGGAQDRKEAAPDRDDDSTVPDTRGDADNQHPSGKDRHENKGTQGQSTSNPDGDGKGMDRTNTCETGTNDNTKSDKPYGATSNGSDGGGGCDQADQDGNNGCGNDDDFEDDNNGWCGKPERTNGGGGGGNTGQLLGGGGSGGGGGGGSGGSGGSRVLGITAENVSIPTAVLGTTLSRTEAQAVAAANANASPRQDGAGPAQVAAAGGGRPTEVLGNVITRTAGAPLARTGLALGLVALLGLGLVAGGQALRRAAADRK